MLINNEHFPSVKVLHLEKSFIRTLKDCQESNSFLSSHSNRSGGGGGGGRLFNLTITNKKPNHGLAKSSL